MLQDLKRELKQWEVDFQQKNGRKPEKKDIDKDPFIGIFKAALLMIYFN
jgi:hypothetical protein